MDIIRFSISKPVTISVGVLLIVLFGVISIGQIPIQLTPNIETTVVSITTRWEGATPQQVETEIIQEQEDKIKSIAGLSKMISVCSQGQGQITLEFVQGTTKEEALREASDKLREVPDYPENVDEPVVEATNPADRDYIAWVIFSSTDPDYDIRTLYDFLDDRVKPEMERVPGISEVNVVGGIEREVRVKVDPEALAQRGITPTQFVAALRAQNIDASAGQLAEGKRDIRIRSVGRYDRLDQIDNTLLSAPGEPVVRVKDVATAELTYKEADRMVRNKGRVVVAMNAQREVGSNVIEVMKGFQQRLDEVKNNLLPAESKRLGLKGEITAEQVYDQTVYIYQALDLVQTNLWVGGSIAVCVLLAFLRSVRSTLIIALAIPVSVVGTFVAMVAMGRSLNVISLAGLAFAVGMVVDNAIVVLENIDRHRTLGEKPMTAAYRAAKEVWGAVLASTLTTLSVFLPVLFIQEEAGQLFRDISLAICAAVTLSLIVSITVIPTAASRWLRPRPRKDESDDPSSNTSRVPHGVKWVLLHLPTAMVNGFASIIERLNHSWVIRPLIIAGMTIGSIAASYLLMPPSSYLPAGNRNLVFAIMLIPSGYNIDQQQTIGERIETKLRPYWEARNDPEAAKNLPPVPSVNMQTGETKMVQPPALENFFFVALPDLIFMGGISSDDSNVAPVADLMNDSMRGIPDAIGFAQQRPLFRTATRGSGDAMELEIAGPQLDQVTRIASLLYQRYGAQYGFMRLQPDPSNFNMPGTEIVIERKPVEATDVGLGQGDINTAVQMLGDGAIIGDYLNEGKNVDLKVITADSDHGDAGASIEQAPIATPIGMTVPLASIADVYRTVAPQQINRVEEQRAVILSINLPQEMPLEEAMNQINADIAEMRAQGVIPPTVSTNLAGSAAKLREVKHALLGEWTGFNVESLIALISSRMFLALIVVFLLMAALFESWFYPLVIMFSVPLATVGGFVALRLCHEIIPSQQLDVLTMLGFVILIGIVVNNAILIVHQSLNLINGVAEVQVEGEVAEKLPPKKAIAESVRSRVRPIFMTTLTSVGGMLPLVLFPGAGSELYRGLGSVIVGGLVCSTVFTLVLVPLLLSLVFDVRDMVVKAASKVTGGSDSPVEQSN
ncbi:efflux RND transporter permease subunit [Planctomycetales bacterium ZRK34]|nr:efflux RND transporter permease subunit [Planctomycetales bacterium ZRK34]